MFMLNKISESDLNLKYLHHFPLFSCRSLQYYIECKGIYHGFMLLYYDVCYIVHCVIFNLWLFAIAFRDYSVSFMGCTSYYFIVCVVLLIDVF